MTWRAAGFGFDFTGDFLNFQRTWYKIQQRLEKV